MIAAGMVVAASAGLRNLALGRVTPDGANVIWYEIIDHEGRPASAYGGMKFDQTPMPLRGDKIPCPPEFTGLVP